MLLFSPDELFSLPLGEHWATILGDFIDAEGLDIFKQDILEDELATAWPTELEFLVLNGATELCLQKNQVKIR